MILSLLVQTFVTNKSTMKLIASISGSLGSLLVVALLVCGILIVAIVVLTKKIGMIVQCQHYVYLIPIVCIIMMVQIKLFIEACK